MKKTVFIAFVLSALVAACVDSKTGGSEDGPQNSPADTTFTQYPGPADTTVTPDPADTTVTPDPGPADTTVTPDPADTTVTPDPGPVDTTVTPGPVDTTVTPDPGPVDPPVIVVQWDTVRLRIFDYNVGCFNKNNGSFNVTAPKVAQIVDANRADIICLQEVDNKYKTNLDQMTEFKNITPPNSPGNVGSYWQIFYGANINNNKGSFGVGVMWKNSLGTPVKMFHTSLAKEDGREMRGFATVEFEHFVIMSVHFDDQSAAARQHQTEAARDLAVEKYQSGDKLVIMTGDFNGVINGGVDIAARKAFTRVSSDDPTTPASGPKNNPDMMFVLNNGAKYKVVSAQTLNKSTMCGYGPAEVSDHRPILVELEYYYKK